MDLSGALPTRPRFKGIRRSDRRKSYRLRYCPILCRGVGNGKANRCPLLSESHKHVCRGCRGQIGILKSIGQPVQSSSKASSAFDIRRVRTERVRCISNPYELGTDFASSPVMYCQVFKSATPDDKRYFGFDLKTPGRTKSCSAQLKIGRPVRSERLKNSAISGTIVNCVFPKYSNAAADYRFAGNRACNFQSVKYLQKTCYHQLLGSFPQMYSRAMYGPT